MTQDPRSIYTQLLQERRTAIAMREKRHQLFGYFRLGAAAAGVAMVWMALAQQSFSILWASIPLAVFVGLIVLHEHLLRRLDRHRRAVRYFERALARLDGNWPGTGETGERYIDPVHCYAQDLDLFGKGSLFELLSTARSHIGEDTLARWLLEPAAADLIRARQQAVNELRPRLDLREDLAVVAEEARTGVAPVALAAWGEAAGPAGTPLPLGRLRAQIGVLALLGVAAGAALIARLGYSANLVHITENAAALLRDFVLVVAAINGWFLYRHRAVVGAVVAGVSEAADELKLLSEVLVRLERERFETPMLAELRASLDAGGEPPSARLAQLKRLMEYIDSRDNLFVRIAEIFILWTPYWAVQVEAWRRRSGTVVRRWLVAVGEIEALCSLASHAFEHPQDCFPEFIGDGPFLEAEGAAHPLLPEDRAVRNSVRIGGSGSPRVLVVSGSNMSGKSTFLRTLGVNAVLAQAGATVRARKLTMSRLAIGASIRVSDSLQGGISRFYAEILRLRQILDETKTGQPVLFLIDEFLHGTNSHDRRIGAEALVRGLVERGAIGLITTHDLALADIADALAQKAANVHFEDRVENGEILFDYVMRPGVVRKSNAIELMRSVGLEI
jgi:MutS-like protein